MILEVLILAFGSTLTIVIGQVFLHLIRQQRANKSWSKLSPNLPVPSEYASLFGGHTRTVIFQSRNVDIVDKLHRKYGKTFGLLYNQLRVVVTTDLDLIKTMLIDEPVAHTNRFIPDIPLAELEDDCIAFAEDNQWRRLRQAAAPAFTSHKIKTPNVQAEMESVIEEFVKSINRRIDLAEREKGESFVKENVDDIFHRYALALVFKCFYKKDNIINFDSKQDYWINLIKITLKHLVNPILVLCTMFPILKMPLNWLLQLPIHSQGIVRSNIMSFIKQQTKLNLLARTEFKEKHNNLEKFDTSNFLLKDGSRFSSNLIDYIIDQFHDGKLSESEYFNTSFFIFFAANKTSADALSMLIYQLAINQDKQDKLREEIEAKGLESEYLLWCINESMRLFPPAPIGSTRRITRDYTTKEGYLIPANTIVYTSAYSIHRSKEYWGEDADQYKPERWTNAKEFNPVQYLTFGVGKRNCPGKYFALHEMKMLMNNMMRQFKFEACPETTANNSFQSPVMIFTVFDEPHIIKISRI